MVVNRVLDEIFSRWSNVAVLRALNKYAIGISGREVARIAGISAKNCFIALNDLEDLGIVTRVRGGRDHLFSLNRNHFIVIHGIIPLFEIEAKFLESILSEVKKKLKGKIVGAYLFGSVARREDNIQSDLDLCLIYNNQNNKTSIENIFFELSLELQKKYFIQAVPFLITEENFIRRARYNKPPVNEIIKEGKLIFGKSIKAILNDKRSKKS